MKTMRKVLCFIVVVAMIVVTVPNTVTAATKVRLNKKKVTLTITDKKKNPTTTLKVKGVSKKAAKKVKWSSSKKFVATVKNGKVTAKKAGTTTITCKVTNPYTFKVKRYTCKAIVVDKRTPVDSVALDVSIKKASDIKYSYKTKHTIINDGTPQRVESTSLEGITVTKNDGTTTFDSNIFICSSFFE